MAVFISKKALTKIPNEFTSTYIPLGRKVLRSHFLRTKPFFNNLVKQSQGAKELKNGDSGDVVGSLQVLINVIRDIQTDTQISLTIDNDFGPNTELELKNVQQDLGLPQTGILDSTTLLAMDNLLLESGAIHNTTNGQVYYKGSGSPNRFYSVDIFSENGKIFIDTELTQEIQARPIPENGSVALNIPAEEEVRQMDAVDLEGDFSGKTLLRTHSTDNVLISPPAVFLEQGLLPQKPSGLPPDARPRTVQEGETLVSIIHEEYLQNAYPIHTIPGDDTSAILHEFPARSLSQDDKDYRIRFYANLIYYLNTDPGITFTITRNSAVSNAVDYTDAHLDEVNIYDNQTFGLNYKNFLESIQMLDPNYDWNLYSSNYTVPTTGQSYTFDAPFTLEVGRDLYLPSREFVEALYLHLNFRPKEGEMYEKVTEGNNSRYEWISQTSFDAFIDNVRNAISDPVEEALTADLYTEAYTFFKNIYDWIIDQVAENWPRSMGFEVSAGLGAGLLVGGDLSGDVFLWRKVTPKNELIFRTVSKGSLAVNVAAGIGGSISTLKKGKTANVGSHRGKKKNALFDVTGYAGVQASLSLDTYQEHEFPIRKENTALLAMMLPIINSTNGAARGLTTLLNYLEVINIDPFDYITKLSISLNRSLTAGAQLNLSQGVINESNYGENGSGGYDVDKENHDALNLNQIGKLLKKLDLTFGLDLALNSGYSVEFTFEYNDLPHLYKFDGRMPSYMKVEHEFSTDAQLDTDFSSRDIITRFIIGTLSITGPFDFFSTLGFDKGMAVVFGIEYTRTQPSENHIFADYVWQELGITDPNGNIDRFIGAKVYSGNFLEPAIPGSAIQWNLDIDRLGEFIRDEGIDPFDSLEDVFEILGTIEYRKRFGLLNFESYVSEKNMDTFSSVIEKVKRLEKENYGANLKEIVDSANRNLNLGLNFKSSLELGVVFKLDQALNALQYLFYRIWFIASKTSLTSTVYSDKKLLIDQSYGNKRNGLINGTTVPATFFDELLNDNIDGIKTILEIQPDGSSNLNLITVGNLIGLTLRYFDREGGNNEATITDNLDIDLLFAEDLYRIWQDIVRILLLINEVDLKFNTLIAGNLGLAFTGGAGGRIKLRAYFEAGFFDEVLLLEKGRFPLEGVQPQDDALYGFLLGILNIFSEESAPVDYSHGNHFGGFIGELVSFENTKAKNQ